MRWPMAGFPVRWPRVGFGSRRSWASADISRVTCVLAGVLSGSGERYPGDVDGRGLCDWPGTVRATRPATQEAQSLGDLSAAPGLSASGGRSLMRQWAWLCAICGIRLTGLAHYLQILC